LGRGERRQSKGAEKHKLRERERLHN
jgi:hypothetical protein